MLDYSQSILKYTSVEKNYLTQRWTDRARCFHDVDQLLICVVVQVIGAPRVKVGNPDIDSVTANNVRI